MNRKIAVFLCLPPLLAGLFFAFACWRLRAVPLEIPAELRWPGGRGPVSLRYTGVAGYEVRDGTTTILVDPMTTRPTLVEMFTRRLRPDSALNARVFPEADFILIKHAHYDHLADAADIARRTGATIVGTESALNFARSRGIGEDKLILGVPGAEVRLGTFGGRIAAYRHAKVLGMERFLTGTIPKDAGPLWWWQYRMDGALAYHLESAGVTLLFGGSGGIDEAPQADTLILAAAGPKHSAESFAAAFEKSGAERLILAHFDNFMQPLAKGLTALPVVDLAETAALARQGAPGKGVYALDYQERVALPAPTP